MNQRPFFSIVIPCFNVEKYLSAALNSVVDQTFVNWEIVLVDDCSTDNTLDIASGYASRDDRIQVLSQSINQGLSKTRNRGMSHAAGDYICFLDPDDRFDSELLSTVKQTIDETNAEVVVWGVCEEYFNEEGSVYLEIPVTVDSVFCETKEAIAKELLLLEENTLFGYAWNKAYSRTLLEAEGIRFLERRYIEDILFNVDVAKNLSSLSVIGKSLYRYGRRPASTHESLTSKLLPDFFPLHEERIRVLLAFFETQSNLIDHAKEVLGAIYYRYAFSALCRNNDPHMNMSMSDRRLWLDRFFDSDLYIRLCHHAKPKGRLSQMIGKSFTRKRKFSLLLGSYVVWGSQRHFPKLFQRLKQDR